MQVLGAALIEDTDSQTQEADITKWPETIVEAIAARVMKVGLSLCPRRTARSHGPGMTTTRLGRPTNHSFRPVQGTSALNSELLISWNLG
jgi:hypothetical protein